MKPAEALQSIRGYASANRYEYSMHARRRMRERNVKEGDVHNALTQAKACVSQPKGLWKSTGPDLDGDDLDLIVEIEDGLIIVTLY